MTASIVIGISSTLLLLVFVYACNLAVGYIRLQPWSETDGQFIRWCVWCGLGYIILSGLL